jgi:Sugar-transfer associated ATP-grasp
MISRLRRSVEQIRTALAAAGDSARERTGKSHSRQAIEMLLHRARGFTPDDYYTLRLYERAPALGAGPMRHREFSQLRFRLNPQQAEVVPFNKWVCSLYLETLGVRVPACHGLYHRNRGILRNGQRLATASDLALLLARVPGGVVIKPLDASHGQNVTVIVAYDAASGRITRANGTRQTLEDLVATLDRAVDGWVVQDRIVQHPALAALHPQSVNTVRLVTLCRDDGVPEVIGAVLRIGTGNSEIDNTTGGGIVASVDLESGRCGYAISRYRASEHATHPGSGVEIAGFQVPHWPLVVTEAIRAHRLLPFPRTLGWDVAIEDRGPVVLEVNSDYYHNHLQLDGGGSAAIDLLRQSVGTSAGPRL